MNNYLDRFEYYNAWNSPKFWFQKDIGQIVGIRSLDHGLDLAEYHEEKTLFKSSGFFRVVGEFYDVRRFGEQLEKDYGQYLILNQTDWDYYQNYFEGT